MQCAEAASLGGLFHFANVTCWQILLQKSFWGDDRKFLEPLMRFTRGDVRDHIVSSKIDHGPPWRRCKATQQQRSRSIFDFCNNIGTKRTCRSPWRTLRGAARRRQHRQSGARRALTAITCSTDLAVWHGSQERPNRITSISFRLAAAYPSSSS